MDLHGSSINSSNGAVDDGQLSSEIEFPGDGSWNFPECPVCECPVQHYKICCECGRFLCAKCREEETLMMMHTEWHKGQKFVRDGSSCPNCKTTMSYATKMVEDREMFKHVPKPIISFHDKIKEIINTLTAVDFTKLANQGETGLKDRIQQLGSLFKDKHEPILSVVERLMAAIIWQQVVVYMLAATAELDPFKLVNLAYDVQMMVDPFAEALRLLGTSREARNNGTRACLRGSKDLLSKVKNSIRGSSLPEIIKCPINEFLEQVMIIDIQVTENVVPIGNYVSVESGFQSREARKSYSIDHMEVQNGSRPIPIDEDPYYTAVMSMKHDRETKEALTRQLGFRFEHMKREFGRRLDSTLRSFTLAQVNKYLYELDNDTQMQSDNNAYLSLLPVYQLLDKEALRIHKTINILLENVNTVEDFSNEQSIDTCEYDRAGDEGSYILSNFVLYKNAVFTLECPICKEIETSIFICAGGHIAFCERCFKSNGHHLKHCPACRLDLSLTDGALIEPPIGLFFARTEVVAKMF